MIHAAHYRYGAEKDVPRGLSGDQLVTLPFPGILIDEEDHTKVLTATVEPYIPLWRGMAHAV